MTRPLRSILRLALLACVPTMSGACTMVAGTAPSPVRPPPVTTPGPSASEPVSSDPAGPVGDERSGSERITTRVVEIALESIGTPYRWGGTGANGFDCSGLIQFAYGQLGIPLPRVSSAQIRSGAPVRPEPDRLRPGDVLGFSGDGSGKTSHVGLYIGDEAFIHSGSTGVRISTLRNAYWRGTLVAARRIVE